MTQLEELKIKVHLPLNFSGRMPTNPDKVVNVGTAKRLTKETFSGLVHLKDQQEQKIELKLSRFKIDSGGK